MILIAKQKWRHRHRKETYGHQGREGGRDELGDWDGHIYAIDTVCKIDNKSYSIAQGTRLSALLYGAQSLQFCLTLCHPMDCSLSCSSVHGILQERILEWVAISSSRGSSQIRDRTWVPWVSCIVQFSSVAQSCPTLCDPMNHSMPGLPVHHQLPESTQTHVHWVGDAIQPSILCCPLLLLPSIFPSIRVFSYVSVLRIRWPKSGKPRNTFT